MIYKLIISDERDRKGRPGVIYAKRWRGVAVRAACLCIALVGRAQSGHAEAAVSCGGFAMLGGAQIACSHVAPKQPLQFCTFSWTLTTADNALSTVAGSFIVPPGGSNVTVYQGAGFTSALSNPIVLCQGRKSR